QQAGLARQLLAAARQHLASEVDAAVPGGLGADRAAAERRALAGDGSMEGVLEPLVLAVEVADLARADADVARRHIDVRADVAVELGHERLAKAHHLAVRASLGIEVRSPLATAERQRRQAVLEDLLEAEELEDAQVDRLVKTQAPFVGTDRVVELDTIT